MLLVTESSLQPQLFLCFLVLSSWLQCIEWCFSGLFTVYLSPDCTFCGHCAHCRELENHQGNENHLQLDCPEMTLVCSALSVSLFTLSLPAPFSVSVCILSASLFLFVSAPPLFLSVHYTHTHCYWHRDLVGISEIFRSQSSTLHLWTFISFPSRNTTEVTY